MIGIIIFGISDQLRDIYSIYRCCWNVATYKCKVHNGKIEIISFVVKFSSYPALIILFSFGLSMKDRNIIFLHSTGYQQYRSVRANNIISWEL